MAAGPYKTTVQNGKRVTNMKQHSSKTTTVTFSIQNNVLKIEYNETARQELLVHNLNRMLDGNVFSASHNEIKSSTFLQIKECNDPLEPGSYGWYFLPKGTLVIKTKDQSLRNDLVSALKLGTIDTNKLARMDMSKNTVMAYTSNERQKQGIYFEVSERNNTRSTLTREDLAQEKSVSFSIEFTEYKIKSHKRTSYLKDGSLDQSEEAYRKLFLDSYDELVAQDQNRFFGFFNTSQIMENWPLNKILEHAANNNDNSRKACIHLGWMQRNGVLNNNAPKAIKLAADDRMVIGL